MRGEGKNVLSQLWTANAASSADRYTMESLGMPSPVLMERAALAVAQEIDARFHNKRSTMEVCLLCGPGNNGGDGFALARQLVCRGYSVSAYLLVPSHSESVLHQLSLARNFGVSVHEGVPTNTSASVLVDAMLGTGAKGAPRGAIKEAIEWFNHQNNFRVAIDVPTGVNPDDGTIHEQAAKAQLTVTFQRSKPGLHIIPGRYHAGEVVVADIGIFADPKEQNETCFTLIDPAWVGSGLKNLPVPTHKGERGHVGVVGGSAGTPGAAVLAATAALRCGAGLVTIASTDSEVQAQIIAHRPELMVEQRQVTSIPVARANVLIVGPGLTHAEDRRDLQHLYENDERPSIWDASALEEVMVRQIKAKAPRILTPHPGEAASMLHRFHGSSWNSQKVQEARVLAARTLAEHTHAIVVLKGEGTLVVDEKQVAICVSGGPSLATAGTGDCLTGFIAAMIARGLSAWEAACAGVYIHGVAGELAQLQNSGCVAMDVADAGAAVLDPDSYRSHHPRWPRLRFA